MQAWQMAGSSDGGGGNVAAMAALLTDHCSRIRRLHTIACSPFSTTAGNATPAIAFTLDSFSTSIQSIFMPLAMPKRKGSINNGLLAPACYCSTARHERSVMCCMAMR